MTKSQLSPCSRIQWRRKGKIEHKHALIHSLRFADSYLRSKPWLLCLSLPCSSALRILEKNCGPALPSQMSRDAREREREREEKRACAFQSSACITYGMLLPPSLPACLPVCLLAITPFSLCRNEERRKRFAKCQARPGIAPCSFLFPLAGI